MSRPSSLSNHPAVSFTVRRPSPLSRQTSSGPDSDSSSSSFRIPNPVSKKATTSGTPSPLATSSVNRNGKRTPTAQHIRDDDDSSDDDAGTEDEIITGFDAMGVQRAREIKPVGPLIIPALENRDWRAAARKRQALGGFIPDSARAVTGKDGSVGGLGTRDSINSGPQLSGLITKVKEEEGDTAVDEDIPMTTSSEETVTKVEIEEEDEDKRALKALLHGTDDASDQPLIDAIPLRPPQTETDAYRQDVDTRPDLPSLDDYARVPVEQFGAALLRGMGWKEGMAASRTRKGPAEPYLPSSRPALLGLGAKERPVDANAAPAVGGGKVKLPPRPEKRYVPLLKKEREGGASSSRSHSHSHSHDDDKRVASSSSSSRRHTSRSPPPRKDDRDRRRDDRSDDKYKDRERESSSSRRSDRDRDRETSYESDNRRGYDSREKDRARSERERDRDRGSDRERDYRREKDDRYKSSSRR